MLVHDIEERIVFVSALDETHAIVRRPNCSRYVAEIDQLKPLE